MVITEFKVKWGGKDLPISEDVYKPVVNLALSDAHKITGNIRLGGVTSVVPSMNGDGLMISSAGNLGGGEQFGVTWFVHKDGWAALFNNWQQF